TAAQPITTNANYVDILPNASLRIRQWEKQYDYAPLSIIALTAHTEAEHKERVFESGMDYYLSKPVTLEKVREALIRLGFLAKAY
ncbi:MAG: response regulator, partial [Moraxellaceae bacterium]